MANQDIQRLIDEAEPGAEVLVPAGSWRGGLRISKSLRLVGEGLCRIDGEKQQPCILIDGRHTEVSFQCRNLHLVNGQGLQGGGLFFEGPVQASVVDCTIEHNVGSYFGGGGVYAERGTIEIRRSVIRHNSGKQGGGILANKFARFLVVDSLLVQNSANLGGGICLKDKATLACHGVTLSDNSASKKGSQVYAHGTLRRHPEIELVRCIVDDAEGGEALGNSDKLPANFVIHHSLVPPDTEKIQSVELGEGVTLGRANFADRETYAPEIDVSAPSGADPSNSKAGERDGRGGPSGAASPFGAVPPFGAGPR